MEEELDFDIQRYEEEESVDEGDDEKDEEELFLLNILL